MADQTTPTTPPAQDLQINLEEAQKAENTTTSAIETAQPELDLSLDLNLPEAPKTDDRLKAEDEKNQETPKTEEIKIETEEAKPMEKKEEIPTPVIEDLFTDMPVAESIPMERTTSIAEEKPKTEEIQEEKTEKEISAIPEPEKVEEVKTEEIPVQETTPSTSIEEVTVPVAKIEETMPQTLQSDIKIIDALEGHASA